MISNEALKRGFGGQTVKQIRANHAIRLALIFIGIFVLAALILGSFHLTHGGGWRSGVVEIFFACLLAALGGLIYRSQRKGDSPAGRGYLVALLITNGVIALVLLTLSAYHFTHNGIPSGAIEIMLAAILTAIDVLISRGRAL
jgi:hypothetical protein